MECYNLLMEPNLDGWLISDAIAHLLKLAAPPLKAPEPHVEATHSVNTDEGGHWGFCDVCEHTWQFCECDD